MKKLLFIIAIAVCVVSCNSNSKKQNDAVEDTITTETVSIEVVENDSTAMPIVLDFTADWCVWCKRLEPTLQAAEKKHSGNVEFKKVDTDQNPEIAQQYEVKSLPTLVFLDKDGNEVTRIVGFTDAQTIEEAILQIKK